MVVGLLGFLRRGFLSLFPPIKSCFPEQILVAMAFQRVPPTVVFSLLPESVVSANKVLLIVITIESTVSGKNTFSLRVVFIILLLGWCVFASILGVALPKVEWRRIFRTFIILLVMEGNWIFPSAIWFGDEIWRFDPGIFGAWNDNEDDLKTWFLQTPVHNTGYRPGHRIWWSEQSIRLCLYLLVVPLNLWGLDILDLLGSRVMDRWGCDLPFLFTALSVTNALSFMGIGEITPLYFIGSKTNSQTYWIISHGPMALSMALRCLEELFAFMEFTQAALVVRRWFVAYSQGISRSWYRMEKEAKSKFVQMTMIQKFWYLNVNISELIWKHQVYHAVSKHGVSAKKWSPRIIRIRARFYISSHYMAHKYAYVIIWFSNVLYTDFVNLS